MFGLIARSFAFLKGFDKYDNLIRYYLDRFSLEKNIVLGLSFIGLGTLFIGTILVKWVLADFGPLFEVRKGIVASTLFAIGFQYISASFVISMLLMESNKTK
jgi:hypothetical protein